MADLDRELASRLSRLADAVPVSAMHLDPVHRTAVRARQRVRMAWVTPLALVIGIAVVATAMGVGPFTALVNGPVTATTRNGDFELTIRSAHGHYAAGEPIDVSATLTYLGSASPIEIGHEFGDDGAPIGFGVAEPIFPGYVLSGEVSRLMCHRTSVARDAPVAEAFRKSGGGYGPGDGTDFLTYMRDPVFWLNQGTWHPNAIASFSVNPMPPGSCGSDIVLRVQIAITVGPSPRTSTDPTVGPVNTPASSEAPTLAPTPAPIPTPPAVVDVDSTGPYTLRLTADRATYHESDAIQITATFSYGGKDPIAVEGFVPAGFSIAEPVHGIDVGEIFTLVCTHDVLQPGQRINLPFTKGGAVSSSDPLATEKLAWLKDPVLRLPPGTWHVRASSSLTEGTCGDKTVSLSTEIVIQVLPDP